jgi:hypothetical protein
MFAVEFVSLRDAIADGTKRPAARFQMAEDKHVASSTSAMFAARQSSLQYVRLSDAKRLRAGAERNRMADDLRSR